MGTLTYAEIKTEVIGFLGGRTDFTARVDNIVNLAQMRIARLSVFEELNTTLTDDLTLTASISDDKKYTLPSNLRNIYAIKVYDEVGTRYKRLVGLPSAKFDEKIANPEKLSRGMPDFYHRWGSAIEMYPIIDQDYKIDVRYSAWPTPFTTEGQKSDLTEKDDAIIVLAASWMFMSLKKKEDANFQWSVYKNMMTEILGEDRESPDITYGLAPKVGHDGVNDPFIRQTV